MSSCKRLRIMANKTTLDYDISIVVYIMLRNSIVIVYYKIKV